MILLEAVPHSNAADFEPPFWNPADTVDMPLNTISFANGFVSVNPTSALANGMKSKGEKKKKKTHRCT